MSKNRGNISLFIVVGILFFIVLMQSIVVGMGQNLAAEEEYLRERQLRLLGISAAKKLSQVYLAAGSKEICSTRLYPGGGEAKVVSKNIYSDDSYFRYFDVHVTQGNLSYWLRQTTFNFPPSMQEQSKRSMFICSGSLQGKEYLLDGNVGYTSNEEVCFPQIGFLSRDREKLPSVGSLDVAAVEKAGLGKMFYYLKDGSRSFAFTPGSQIRGTAAIAAEKGISIGKNSHFFDSVLLLAHGPCRIQENVELDHVVIIASGPVTIEKGCKINGVIFCCQDISLLGESNFTHDGSGVAPLSSVFLLQ